MTAAKRGRDLGPFGAYEIIRRDDGARDRRRRLLRQARRDRRRPGRLGLAESARGQGYATEALIALLEWAAARTA